MDRGKQQDVETASAAVDTPYPSEHNTGTIVEGINFAVVSIYLPHAASEQ